MNRRNVHGASFDPDTLAILPMHLPDFELLAFIGRGGYGDVWLARDAAGRHWAVKIVYRSSFDDDRPYEREYKGILRFFPVSAQSESQLRVMHVGRRDADGCFYYIMELADDASGAEQVRSDSYLPHTLRSELKCRRRIPASEVAGLAWGLTSALENLHANGLVHRDIKPGNIIFVGGRPKLADVGLVTDADLTRTYAGTEGYIPPEGPGTYRADIYSLGMTLYEACTGCDRRQFPALPENVAELPDHGELLRLIRVINRACQPDRRKRYQSAGDMRRDLERLLRGGAAETGNVLW
jgi:serine/threonine protein kinase